MEYRRRKKAVRARRKRRSSSAGSGSALRAIILLGIFGAAVFLFLKTGSDKKLEQVYARNLLSSCLRDSREVPSVTEPPAIPSASPEPSPAPLPTGETARVELPGIGVHMLQMGFYSDESECRATAQKLREQGAAGYVYDDNGSLRLIAAAYSDKASAESVLERLTAEGVQCTVFSLERSGAELMITASEERLAPIRTAFGLCAEAVDQLDELAIDFDAENRSVEYGLEVLSELRLNVFNAKAGIDDIARSNGMLTFVCDYFDGLTGLISEAAQKTASKTAFASALKTLRIGSALLYIQLLENIGA